MERECEKEKEQKVSMEKYIQSQHSFQKSRSPVSTQNQISDLLQLANEELEKKSKLISELQMQIKNLQCNNIEALEEDALNELRQFYGSKLSSIVAALTNISNQK